MFDYTFGAEEEFMVVQRDGQPFKYNMESLLACGDRPAQLSVEPHEGSIEVATSICQSLPELHTQIMQQRAFLRNQLSRQGGLVLGSSTIPWLKFEDVETISADYYRQIAQEYGYAIKGLLIFGLHVHVGGISAQKFPHVFNLWRYYTPVIIALSANSRSFNGCDTGMSSFRNMRILSMPRSGLPPAISSVQELHHMMDTLHEEGFTRRKTQIWTDFRLHPVYHTLEIRMADVQQQDEHAAALGLLMAALTIYFAEHADHDDPCSRMPAFLLNENRWMACKDGVRAFFMTPNGKKTMVSVIEDVFDKVKPLLDAAGACDVIDTLQEMMLTKLSTTASRITPHADELQIRTRRANEHSCI